MLSGKRDTLEFLDLIVEGCATMWLDLRAAFTKFDERHCGRVIASDFVNVFRVAFNVTLSPAEAQAVVEIFDPSGLGVRYASFCEVIDRELAKGYKVKRER